MNKYVLQTNNLSKSFGKMEILHEINMSIKHGDVYGLIGQNGAGKTTLLRLISGLMKPTKGTVNLQTGKPFIGYMPQSCRFDDNATVFDTIRFFARLRNTDTKDCDLFGKKMKLDMGKKVKYLSPGQQKKLQMIIAMAGEPDLYILDEPTAGLDPNATFDLISSDREHNVLDCIICSGIPKARIFISKVLVTAVMSLVLSFIYMMPVTCAIIGLSRNFAHMYVLIQYFLPLWGYIMVYAAMGMLISVLARSSKAALIWSLASGLLLMPRFFVMIVEGIGKIFGWTTQMIENVSLIAPGVMMQALSEVSDTSKFWLATAIFGISILTFLVFAYWTFIRQDEYNYGE